MTTPFTNPEHEEDLDWRFTLICRSIIATGESKPNIHNGLRAILKRSNIMAIHMLSNEIFLLRFSSLDSLNVVLKKGPWSIYGQLILMKRYFHNLPPQQVIFESYNIWFHFDNLPYMKSSQLGIFKLLDRVLPISDFHPNNKNDHPPPEGISVRTTIKLDKKLPKGLFTDDSFGGQQWVKFIYHNLPSQFCDHCRLMGHTSPLCPDRMQQADDRIQHSQWPRPSQEERELQPNEPDLRNTTHQQRSIRREQ
ncbi:hypothetical protein FRX31_014297, partial [Thalictrum thalictroides]